MANANFPRGLFPLCDQAGKPYNGAVRTYYVPSGNATALFFGDPLITIDNSADANGVPAVGIATAGSSNYSIGAFMGVTDNAGTLVVPLLQSSPVYLPANTAAYVMVADDPFLLYAIQENGSGGAMAAGAASRNANLVAGAGSTVTGFSGWQLASNTLQTTNTLQLRIIQAVQSIDNAVGLYAKWLVRINLHQMLNPTGT